MIAAGGFGRYERNHLDALAATFAPHFSHLPPEIVRLVVEYAFHAGYCRLNKQHHIIRSHRSARSWSVASASATSAVGTRPRSVAKTTYRRAARRRVGPAAGGGADQRAALAAAPIHEAVVLARRGRVAARRAEAQLRAVPLKDDGRVLATATHVRRQVVGRVAERLEPAWT